MAAEPLEITLHLSPAVARRLVEMAADEGTTVEAVAQRVLAESVPSLPDSPDGWARYLDEIPGFRDEFLESAAQIRRGDTVPASELRET